MLSSSHKGAAILNHTPNPRIVSMCSLSFHSIRHTTSPKVLSGLCLLDDHNGEQIQQGLHFEELPEAAASRHAMGASAGTRA